MYSYLTCDSAILSQTSFLCDVGTATLVIGFFFFFSGSNGHSEAGPLYSSKSSWVLGFQVHDSYLVNCSVISQFSLMLSLFCLSISTFCLCVYLSLFSLLLSLSFSLLLPPSLIKMTKKGFKIQFYEKWTLSFQCVRCLLIVCSSSYKIQKAQGY